MQENSKKLTVIIVNFNTTDLLRDCLRNLDKIYPNIEAVVVDNTPNDNSAAGVVSEFPFSIFHKNQDNLGLSKAHNIAYTYASGEYILFLGTDAYPIKETLQGMIDYMNQNKQVGIATCSLRLRDGSLDMDAHRGFPTPWTALTHFSGIGKLFPSTNIFNRYFLGGSNLLEPHEIDMCISHFMLVRREVFYDIGGWDEDFFVFGEDVDFCYRTKQAGWKIMYLPQWECKHYKGSSIGIRKTTQDVSKASVETKLNMTKHTTRAMELFYKKHLAKKYPFFITWFVLLGIRLTAALRVLRLKRALT